MNSHHAITQVMLLVILTIAVISDVRSHRIPNVLVAAGLIAGLVSGASATGAAGLGLAAAGAFVGLAGLLPFYVLRGMGAGDVKLMAAAGSFFAPRQALIAVAATLLAGGVLACLWVFARRIAAYRGLPLWQRLRHELVLAVLAGPRLMGLGGMREESGRATTPQQRFPYAPAIAAGVAFTMIWMS